ncbi:GMP synthase [Pseudoxanthomonas broegbernensis]|uniref:GMP synthase n=1 Tax=Pseudoxanthomonas broegbernensis TaxID=83619 RepID=A0A7V8GNC1_9GAMM|nr:glutamine amidotransferase [Pseudoxanthomonas broegbernensis]KAF1686922.1 GMP synthase [Pseudoxanthomonas broegbernensis]MBB6065481.1 GMP synthase (glutamine-hydrolyzing) [Pseudoxanthomonas broegbernensis]
MNAARRAPFLIVETGQPVDSLKRYGRFPHWIRVAAGLSAREVVEVNAERGEPLPVADGLAGVIVTGSAAFVTDRAEWSESTAGWLREAAQSGMPLLGICYGHQLLAHALGGQVDYNPAGRESGTVFIDLHPPAFEDPLFAAMPSRFAAHATHLQTVLRPPQGATVLARSEQDQCHAFRWGANAWGMQFHPEFATHHMRGYVNARADCLRRHGRCPRTVAREVSAAPQARQLLRRFVQHARGTAGRPGPA